MKIRLILNVEAVRTLWERVVDVLDAIVQKLKRFATTPLCAIGAHPVRTYTYVEQVSFVKILYYDCGICGRPSLSVLQH